MTLRRARGSKRPALLVEQALIGGVWISATSGALIKVHNPANGEIIGSVPNCGAAEAYAAIDAASRSFPQWRCRPAAERASVLLRWHAGILERRRELAELMTAEQGKPIVEAEAEVDYAAQFVSWFAGEAVRIEGREISAPPDRRVLVRKQPVGVCAAITPWNFPGAMVTRKLAPALAAGCTIVLKPSELTPFTALALAKLAEEAGIPPGCINVVTGEPEAIGKTLTASENVRKLSFTGSTTVGRLLMAQSAQTVKRLSLELGGSAPFLVFDDADLGQAISGLMANKFRNAGQTCVCANRILVQQGVHDEFVARLGAAVRDLVVGDGRDLATEIGPLISRSAADKVRAQIEDAVSKGARVAAEASACAGFGAFVNPVLLTGATTSMRLSVEETFGPLAAIMRFESEAEAVAIANATPYGLAAYFYTSDAGRAWRVAEALDFGMVGLNTGSVSMAAAPFGGMKQSGFGREGGQEGIDEYLEAKTFHWGGLN